jgi:hypothetical protein
MQPAEAADKAAADIAAEAAAAAAAEAEAEATTAAAADPAAAAVADICVNSRDSSRAACFFMNGITDIAHDYRTYSHGCRT